MVNNLTQPQHDQLLWLYETSGLIGTGTERGKVKPGYGTYILNSL
jgi:hypothetical protein